MARFSTFTIGVPFITLPKGLQFTWPNAPENNYIDTLVHAKLKKLRIEPIGHLHRRDVRPPRLPRHHRHAADARRIRPVHGVARCPNKRDCSSTNCSTARSSPSCGC